MTRQSLPRGFSLFSWGLAVFCALYCYIRWLCCFPLHLRKIQTWKLGKLIYFNIFWIYPIILAVVARILYRLHQRKPKLAFKLLVLSAVIFYIALITIFKIGL